MTPFYADELVTLHLGDCVEVMAGMEPESVDAIVTDPPYWYNFMGKAWDGGLPNEDAGFGYYFSGLVDGEGHFRVQAQARGTYSSAFSIHLRRDDRAILEQVRKFLGVGSITEDQSGDRSPMARLNVQAKGDCLRVVEVLTRYPLRAKKLRDFLPWAEAVLEWNQMKRGHRWSGRGDWSRLERLKATIERAREYREIPWSGNSYQDWTREWAEEALRVLKPGGHLLSFSGTRTYHRMTSGLEDAGWEIRDCLVWAYASGFPKSLDVGKAIDKRGGVHADFSTFRDAVKAAMKRNGVTTKKLQEALGNFMLSHYLTAGSQPAVPTFRDYRIIRDTVGLGGGFDHLFADEVLREVIGEKDSGLDGGSGTTVDFQGAKGRNENGLIPVTAPATDAARQWDGWGTALKPAWEPIVMARKPLRGTVSQNVLKYGTGAINIGATRIGTEPVTTTNGRGFDGSFEGGRNDNGGDTREGRWPANLLLTDPIFDGDTPGVVGGGTTNVAWSAASTEGLEPTSIGRQRPAGEMTPIYGDAGTYSRFFLVPKSSRSDREPLTRDEALRLHRESGACDKLAAWESAARRRSDPMGSTSPVPDTSVATSEDALGSGTSLPGSVLTALSHMDTSSTTSTGTSRTTGSPTSSSSTRSPTSASTPAASSATGNGGSPAESADNSSLWEPPTGISPERDGRPTDDADPATSARSWSRSSCGDCGKPLPRVSTHPTQKPTALMRHLVRLVTPPGGLILDCFLGSGTTAIAANAEGFRCIGIEREREYLDITLARLAHQPIGLAL